MANDRLLDDYIQRHKDDQIKNTHVIYYE